MKKKKIFLYIIFVIILFLFILGIAPLYFQNDTLFDISLGDKYINDGGYTDLGRYPALLLLKLFLNEKHIAINKYIAIIVILNTFTPCLVIPLYNKFLNFITSSSIYSKQGTVNITNKEKCLSVINVIKDVPSKRNNLSSVIFFLV